MQVISNTDTICAIATPPGTGGIGVVRMSGPNVFSILERIWKGRVDPAKFESRKLYLGEIAVSIHDPRSTIYDSRSAIHDKVMAVKMPSPNTYTGQDVVELSCHGSQLVMKGIVDACVASGARIAGPGEFTRRAFLAGKMDLAQAEAVADLIHATGERGARLASSQLDGRLSGEINGIISELTNLRGEVEASIDFPEERIEVSGGSLEDRIADIAGMVRRLIGTYENGRQAFEGVRVAIVGRPNSGKSSILNCLAGMDRAIVHHEPGTTRDVVEQSVAFDGTAFHLRDTAGVRDTGASVEAIGIGRTREEMERADLAIAVFDGSAPFGDEDASVLSMLAGTRSLLVVNKSDLPRRFEIGKLGGAEHLIVSAKSGDGIESLVSRMAISSEGGSSVGAEDGATITSARHRAALIEAESGLKKSLDAYAAGDPLECVAQHVRVAHESLGSITGEVTTDELLDRIFSTFCIGK